MNYKKEKINIKWKLSKHNLGKWNEKEKLYPKEINIVLIIIRDNQKCLWKNLINGLNKLNFIHQQRRTSKIKKQKLNPKK